MPYNSPPTGETEPPPDELPPKKRTRRKKPPPPPAVKVYQSVVHRYPPKAWYGKIDKAVGSEQVNLDFWGQVVMEYIGCGWNKGNVKTMLEFYERREIPGDKSNGRYPSRTTPARAGPSELERATATPEQAERDRALLRAKRAEQAARSPPQATGGQ